VDNTCTKFREVWTFFLRYASRQTDTLITVLQIPTGSEVINVRL